MTAILYEIATIFTCSYTKTAAPLYSNQISFLQKGGGTQNNVPVQAHMYLVYNLVPLPGSYSSSWCF